MPAARARATLSWLRPSSEVMTCRPFSVSRLPTAAPMLPGAISATTGFMTGSFGREDGRQTTDRCGADSCLLIRPLSSVLCPLLHSIPREFLHDVRLDRLGGG